MNYKFIATTALVALMSTGAVAMDNSNKTSQMNDSKAQTEMNAQSEQSGEELVPRATMEFSIFAKDVSADATMSEDGYLSAKPGQILASGLMGKTIYSSVKDVDGVRTIIGDINDIVLDKNGSVEAAVVGVGGFVGLGEKDVAVDFSRLQWMTWDNERHLVMASTKAELEAAPEFSRDGVTTLANADMLVIDQNKLSTDQLIGTSVYGEELNEIGEVGDVILDNNERVEAYIVDVGGFLGINAKPVELEADKLNVYADAQGALHVYTPFTQAQLESMPAYEAEDEQISWLK
ncbi:PRC-barrel domain-containing protein [Cohaesibacter marisflavi]|uniref:PRC-barrel domain-containing protein n=1 Tax=Cohaesibacter marisflavi TaxID=655353 RepID=A0A1I5ETH9_9HYPH|nr:PRC-barrel domain-containing protein [Cohaesibacter marisflavi]SFO14832.1 PRC-barrel domain-containing protein [Cohaesibacter marisflavi]